IGIEPATSLLAKQVGRLKTPPATDAMPISLGLGDGGTLLIAPIPTGGEAPPRPTSIGMAGRLRSEQVADINSERTADIVGIGNPCLDVVHTAALFRLATLDPSEPLLDALELGLDLGSSDAAFRGWPMTRRRAHETSRDVATELP